MRAGGYVATGVDWPLAAAPDERVPFFGRPAHLPTGHIRLAISGNALLLPMACRWDPERGYRALTGEPIELELTGDRAIDVQHNARRMLAVMEALDRRGAGAMADVSSGVAGGRGGVTIRDE